MSEDHEDRATRSLWRRRHTQMLYRCTDPRHHQYHLYGGAGVTLCQEWHDFETFYEYAKANLAPLDQPNVDLITIDAALGYQPGNVRLVPSNRSPNANSRTAYPYYNGELLTCREFWERYCAGWKSDLSVRKHMQAGKTPEQIITLYRAYRNAKV